ncbi:hypothetical protein [Streptomyces sp. VRA16 Mangrove soil]|uniref:hypothetical protein n=1 Tax=Streptomyces sp. VRA16 Mangrove soil TaxID=2817434 RepID=UPI001A9DCBD4|nr:hypothetical protein [Streptomyces sp. VRA16 Mangrove soil]MBO1337690.1 hypothetical protein [Streptomyces sp. VRA16 Mangrove soil]
MGSRIFGQGDAVRVVGAGRTEGRGGFGVGRTLATWPWISAAIAAAVVDLTVGAARRFDFHGINGFSTTNYGWLAFTVVGGVVFAWRLAGRPWSVAGVVRPVGAAVVSYGMCFVAVTVTGLVFLPDQSLRETVTTDAPGRALPVALLVLVAGVLAEVVRACARRLSAGR